MGDTIEGERLDWIAGSDGLGVIDDQQLHPISAAELAREQQRVAMRP